jgi:hypothetical protein
MIRVLIETGPDAAGPSREDKKPVAEKVSGAGGGPAPVFRIGSHLPIATGDSLAKGLTAIILRQGTDGGPLRSPPFVFSGAVSVR